MCCRLEGCAGQEQVEHHYAILAVEVVGKPVDGGQLQAHHGALRCLAVAGRLVYHKAAQPEKQPRTQPHYVLAADVVGYSD